MLYREAKIMSRMKTQKLRRLGHIGRLNNGRITKMVLYRTFIGKRGRPGERWLEILKKIGLKHKNKEELRHVGN